jgi:hypothetical protein
VNVFQAVTKSVSTLNCEEPKTNIINKLAALLTVSGGLLSTTPLTVSKYFGTDFWRWLCNLTVSGLAPAFFAKKLSFAFDIR